MSSLVRQTSWEIACECFPESHDLGQDVTGLGHPYERHEVEIVLLDLASDGQDESVDAGEGAAADALGRDVAEEALNHVEPRRARRGKVHVEARVTRELRASASNSRACGSRSCLR